MKYILLLTVLLISSSVVALEPTLTRQSFGKCYYDDGSIIKSSRCPSRLSVGSNNNLRLKGLSEESINWRLNFGKQQADALSSVFAPSAQQGAAIKKDTKQDLDDDISIGGGFGQVPADGVSQGLSDIVNSSNKSAQQNADAAIKNKALADYVSKKYGQEGENLRELIMTGVIDSSNFKVFVD
jgi:hypothetical protein